MKNTEPMLAVRGLKKSFGPLEVLRGIDLDMARGETVALIGPSGTGKSTLLRCLNYLERPDEGTIRIGPCVVRAPRPRTRDVYELRGRTGMVFQNYSLFRNKTALENIMEPMTVVRRIDKETARTKAMTLLERVGLADKADSYPSRLSGGQQQRIGIARAMAVEPDVLLFDEPTSSLDPDLVGEVLAVLRDLAAVHTTMLIATHEMAFAREAADRVVFLEEGRVLEEGPPEQVLEHPAHERVRQFLRKLDREERIG